MGTRHKIIETKNKRHELNDGLKLFIFLMLILLGGGIFTLLGFGISSLMSAKNTSTEMLMQIIASVGVFVLPPFVFAYYFEAENLKFLKFKSLPSIKIILLTALLIFLSNFISSILVQLSHLIPFETFDNAYIKSMLEAEKLTEQSIKRFLNFTSPLKFVLVFFLMAILPALGEELTFRAVFFNLFHRSSKKLGFAILFSGFIFSLVHFQLHNFLAIFFAGCFLAYIYYLSQNIWVSIIAHLVNNGLIVLLSYANNLGFIAFDFTQEDDIPLLVSIFGLLIFVLVFWFYQKLILQEKQNENE